MSNRELIVQEMQAKYGPIKVLDYEEGAKRCYLRFLSKEGMQIAEKTHAAGTQIVVYKMEWRLVDYD